LSHGDGYFWFGLFLHGGYLGFFEAAGAQKVGGFCAVKGVANLANAGVLIHFYYEKLTRKGSIHTDEFLTKKLIINSVYLLIDGVLEFAAPGE
jgi:hypothetical protein